MGQIDSYSLIVLAMFVLGIGFIFALNLKLNVELAPNNIRALGIIFLIPGVLLAGTLDNSLRTEILTLLGTFGGYILAARPNQDQPRK